MDAQHMDQMGSPYLLGHGLGAPCADATTTVRFTRPGRYRLWVRTRDWAYPGKPGRFQVLIGEKPADATFGTDGADWNWQDGGVVNVAAAGKVRIALRDVTGFDAPCDALLFVSEKHEAFTPPNDPEGALVFRRRMLGYPETPEDGGEFALVVAGGGFAGIAAAVSAARHGVNVALIQDRPVLGGNASSEVRVNPIGGWALPPFRRNGDIVAELLDREHGPATVYSDLRPADERRRRVVEAEPRIKCFLQTRLVSAESRNGVIDAVVVQDIPSGRRFRLRGALFADCTGDGTLGALAGAELRVGRESRAETAEEFAPDTPDQLLMGRSQYWYSADEASESGFPACPWALPIASREHFEVSRPKWPPKQKVGVAYVGGWNWETGFTKDPIADAEAIRDHMFRAVYGTWDFLKNRGPDKARYAKARLAWLGHVTGKRESRRLIGDFLLKQQQIADHQIERDGCVTATWYFDIHYPHPQNTEFFPGQEFRSIAYDDPNWKTLGTPFRGRYLPIKPYPIPYRCLYSRNVRNLFMAGRNVSVTHIALGPVRTMVTTGQMGTVVGRAAYLCEKHDCLPRAVYETRLGEFLDLLERPERGGYKKGRA